MELSIIIVSWNVSSLLKKCLTSIYKYTHDLDFEIWVVDNASADGTLAMLKRFFPQVKLIVNQKNLGFAKANNQAIRQAHGQYVLLLNPDTELIDNSLAKLVAFAAEQPRPCLVGPRLLNSDLSLQPSVRRFPKFWDQFFILLKIHNFFPNLKPFKKYYMFDFNYQQVSQVEQLMGAALLIPRQLLQSVGLLDERFWLLFEEVDFCQRVHAAGYQIYFYPGAQIVHHKGQSFARQRTLTKQINFNRNLFRYFHKHHAWWQLFFLWLLQPVSLFLAWLDQSLGLRQHLGKNMDL